MVDAKAEGAVDADYPAVAVEELAIGEDHPEMRLRIEVVAQAAQHDLRVLPVRGAGAIVNISRGLVVGHHEAQRHLAGLACQLRPVPRIHHRSRVDQRQRERRGDLIDLLPLEEKRPQLREEHGEALVDLDLRLVRFDLREVRVVGKVEDEVRRHAVLDVYGALCLIVQVFVVMCAGACMEGLRADRRHRGQELEIPAR